MELVNYFRTMTVDGASGPQEQSRSHKLRQACNHASELLANGASMVRVEQFDLTSQRWLVIVEECR